MGADSRQISLQAARLRLAVMAMPAASRAVMQAQAAALKTQLQAEAQGVKHAPGLPSAITFTTKISDRVLSYEVGPVEGGAGSLALLYFGNSKTGARLKDPRFALERQGELTTAALAALVDRLT